MFTGIVETIGKVAAITTEGSNVHLTIQSPIAQELKIDQSIAHSGVCLTVVAIENDTHTVTAVHETLLKTNLGELKVGSQVNLERCLTPSSRLDGHIVQGHVDKTGEVIDIQEVGGSWYFRFRYAADKQHILIDKGSICIDGTSLTVVDPIDNTFSVAIIPYTYQHTLFNTYQIGTKVNLEFDMVGKYIARLFEVYQKAS